MKYSIADHLGSRRNSVIETMICRQLRAMGEEAAVQAIGEFLSSRALLDMVRHKLGMEIANRVLRNRTSFIALLKLGAVISDASSVKFWIRSIVPRLGIHRFLRYLLRKKSSQPKFVDNMLYWLAGRYRSLCHDSRSSKMLDALAGE